MNRTALHFFGLITCSLALASCGPGVSREVQAVVLSLDGPASVTHARNGRTDPIESHSRLSVGDLVKVSDQGHVRLQILPGILSAVKANSELQIEELRVAKDGNAMVNAMLVRKARLRLGHGLLDAVVEKKDATGATLIVDTSFGVVNAAGECVCRITVTDQRARILCLRGTLQVQPPNGPVSSLEAGFYGDWPADAEVAKRADANGEVQSDVVATLESMRELLVLQAREVFAPAPWRRTVTEKP